jgi:hypothetical protein
MQQLRADALGTITVWPVIEALLGIFWVGSVLWAWRGQISPPLDEKVDERTLGATVILGQLNGIITGTSIIMAGLAAFIALSFGERTTVAPHIKLTAIYAVLALSLALYTMAILPTRTLRVNFVRSKDVALFCSTALYLVLIAAVRFGVGVYLYFVR